MGFRNPIVSLRADQITPGILPPGVILPTASVTPDTIAVGAVSPAAIAVGAITPDALALEAVTGPAIAANAVTANAIAANAVTAAKIGAGEVTAVKLAANAVTAEKIAANAVTAGAIAAGEVTAVKLAANAVTAEKIAANAVTAGAIAANAIDGKIITGAIVRTAASGQRIVLDTGGLVAYDATNAAVTSISAATGVLTATGATISGTINATGGTIIGTRFRTAGTGSRIWIGGDGAIPSAFIDGYNSNDTSSTRMATDSFYVREGTKTVIFDDAGLRAVTGTLALESGNSTVVSTTIRDNTGAVGTFSGPVMVGTDGALGRLSGAFAAAHIPNLDAAKITTGTLSVDRVPNLNGNATAVRIYPGTNADGAVYNVRVTSTPNMGFYDGSTAKLYVNSDGNVLAPQVYSYSTSTRAVYVNSSGGLGTTSSLRAHKCAIADVDPDVVDALLALRPVTFLRVADLEGRREVGLIAEEAVAAGMPAEFLYLSDDGALEGLAYERLPVYLLTAVQHLHARLTHLEGAA